MATLHITLPDGDDLVHELTADVVLGRDASADLQILDAKVSRKHCRFFQQLGAWSVEDLGSANGLWINGTRRTKHGLVAGDEIKIGRTTMRFSVPQRKAFQAPVSRSERERRERKRGS